MKKDRFVAFFDAIMAIIMTIVVLEFVFPGGANFSDLEILMFQILVYAVSFFWLGGMWINIHELWDGVEVIDRLTLWVNIGMLFFTSMIPFFTVYFGRYIDEKIPALLYVIDVLLVTIANECSVECLARHNESVKCVLKEFRISIAIDLGIKIICFTIGLLVFPPLVLIGVIVTSIYLMLSRKFTMNKFKKIKKKQEQENKDE